VHRWYVDVDVDVPLLEANIMASKAVARIVRVPMISKRQHAPCYRVVDSVVDRMSFKTHVVRYR
jgi:hypothetical protein